MGRGRFLNLKLGKRTGEAQRQQKRKLEGKKENTPGVLRKDRRAIMNSKEKPQVSGD